MNQEALGEALAAFAAAPDRSGLERLLDHAGEFIVSQARAWKACSLPFADRCRELLTEMFLILREEFDPVKIRHPRGILSFVSLRLRRLTRPRHETRTVPFGLSEDLPDRGRLDFTAGRLELVEQLVQIVRHGLAETPEVPIRRLEFPFLHVSPDLSAISRFLARLDGDDPGRRLELDKKRHQAFNRSLRSRFERIDCADWREVSAWSAGERSHLAWRIISFSAVEVDRFGETLHARLETWRDSSDPFTTAGHEHLDLVSAGLQAWDELHRPVPASPVARGAFPNAKPAVFTSSEPVGLYGTVGKGDDDVLALLLGLPSVSATSAVPVVAQPAPTWTGKPSCNTDEQVNDRRAREVYQEIATEIRGWWLNLLDETTSRQGQSLGNPRSESPCH